MDVKNNLLESVQQKQQIYPSFMLDHNYFRIRTCSKGHNLYKLFTENNQVCEDCKGFILANNEKYFCLQCISFTCDNCYFKTRNLGIIKCQNFHDVIYSKILPRDYVRNEYGCDDCKNNFLAETNPSWNCCFCQFDLCHDCYKDRINGVSKPTPFNGYSQALMLKTIKSSDNRPMLIMQIQDLIQADSKLITNNTHQVNDVYKTYYYEIMTHEYYEDNKLTGILSELVDPSKNYLHVRGPTNNGFFDAVYLAWALHSNLILSPDDIWMAIMHNVDIFINMNAESVRNFLVYHKDKKEIHLKVRCIDFEDLTERFVTEIRNNTKNNIVDIFKCDFSTTTKVEEVASLICIMSSVRNYFEYSAIPICGIKYISLLGTKEDWIKLKEKTEKLTFLMERDWINKISKHISKFIELFDGINDTNYWNDILKLKNSTNEIRTGAYGMGGTQVVNIQQIDGWILDFFPYDEKNKKIQNSREFKKVPNFISYAPVKLDGNSYLFGTCFSGVSQILLDGVYCYKPVTSVCYGGINWLFDSYNK